MKKLRSYTNLTKVFEFAKRKSKKIYYSSKILEFKNNAKNTGSVMKELMGKICNAESSVPKKLVIEKKKKLK